ncbi:MAG: hypothetical protein KAR56_00235 [Thermoplasmata archaeon]|nr:hypothetical protein [Thermoplasmata archaeon]
MNEIDIFLRLAFLGLTALMFVLSMSAALKTKEMKLIFAAIGFGIFMIEGIILAGGIFNDGLESLVTVSFLVGANFVALVFFYLSIIKR